MHPDRGAAERALIRASHQAGGADLVKPPASAEGLIVSASDDPGGRRQFALRLGDARQRMVLGPVISEKRTVEKHMPNAAPEAQHEG